MLLTPEQIAAKEAELAKKEASFSERETNITKRETAIDTREKSVIESEARTKFAEFGEFVGALVSKGQVHPKDQIGIVQFMSAIDGFRNVEFGEGDGKASKTPLTFFREFLSARPALVEFSEIAGGTGPTSDFTDPDTHAQKLQAFQESEAKAGRTVSVTQASEHFKKGASK